MFLYRAACCRHAAGWSLPAAGFTACAYLAHLPASLPPAYYSEKNACCVVLCVSRLRRRRCGAGRAGGAKGQSVGCALCLCLYLLGGWVPLHSRIAYGAATSRTPFGHHYLLLRNVAAVWTCVWRRARRSLGLHSKPAWPVLRRWRNAACALCLAGGRQRWRLCRVLPRQALLRQRHCLSLPCTARLASRYSAIALFSRFSGARLPVSAARACAVPNAGAVAACLTSVG